MPITFGTNNAITNGDENDNKGSTLSLSKRTNNTVTVSKNKVSSFKYLTEKFGYGLKSWVYGTTDFFTGAIGKLLNEEEKATNRIKQSAEELENDNPDNWFNPSTGWKVAGDVSQGIGYSTPGLATAALTGGASSALGLSKAATTALNGAVTFVSSFVPAAGLGLEEAVQTTGKIGAKEWAYALSSGALEGAVETFTDGLIGGAKSAARGLGSNILGKTVKDSVIREGFLKTVGKSFLSEATEEFISGVFEPYIKRSTIDPNAENATASELFYSALVGGLSGAIMGGSNYAANAGVNVSKGLSVNSKGQTNNLIKTAKELVSSYDANGITNDNVKYAKEVISKLDSKTESNSMSRMQLVGELSGVTVNLSVMPTIYNQAYNIVQNAKSAADTFTYYVNKNTGKSINVTAEELTKGVDMELANSASKSDQRKFVNSIVNALQTNKTLRDVTVMTTANRMAMDTKTWSQAFKSGTVNENTITQSNINSLIEQGTADEIHSVEKTLGINNLRTTTVDEVNSKYKAYIEQNGEKLQSKRKIISDLKSMENETTVTKSIPTVARAIQQGNTRVNDGTADIAINRTGNTFVLYDFSSKQTSKDMDVSEMQTVLKRLNAEGTVAKTLKVNDQAQTNVKKDSGTVLTSGIKTEQKEKNLVTPVTAETTTKDKIIGIQNKNGIVNNVNESENTAVSQETKNVNPITIANDVRSEEAVKKSKVNVKNETFERNSVKETKEIDDYLKNNVKKYNEISEPSRQMVRMTVRQARAYNVSEEDTKLYAEVSARTGSNIVFDQELSDIDGKGKTANGLNNQKGTIFINPTESRTKQYSRILMHELDHTLTNTFGGKKLIAEAFKNTDTTSEEYQELVNRYTEQYNGKGLSSTQLSNIINDEVNSAFADKLATDSRVWQYVLQEEPTAKQKILSFFSSSAKDYADITDFSKESRKYLTEFRKMFNQLESYSEDTNALSSGTKYARRSDEARWSLKYDSDYTENAKKYNDDHKLTNSTMLTQAGEIRSRVASYMSQNKEELNLPEDNEGTTKFGNASYGVSIENSSICIRYLIQDTVVTQIEKDFGRMLTQEEQIYTSQLISEYTGKPECAYCYVSADRRAYDEAITSFINQQKEFVKDVKNGMSITDLKNKYKKGNKITSSEDARFKLWYESVISGNEDNLIKEDEIAGLKNSKESISEYQKNIKESQKSEFNLMTKYANNASHAKTRVNYVAYNGEILTWSQNLVDKLNSMYGMRMYSYSDYSPAFVLENMQMVTDAAVRGLRTLAYTKEADFVRVFGETNMNINMSVFAYEQNGIIAEDAMQGMSWKDAKELRSKYGNAGVVLVATSDNIVKWGMEQDWIDIVIPYHSVFTGGKTVASYFNFNDYNQNSWQKETKTSEWLKDINKSSVFPNVHQNSFEKYFKALQANNLDPKFPNFLNGYEQFKNGEITIEVFKSMNPGYMKLVNETRLSVDETKPVEPNFNESAAMRSLEDLKKQHGFNQEIGLNAENAKDVIQEIAEKVKKKSEKEIEGSFDLATDQDKNTAEGQNKENQQVNVLTSYTAPEMTTKQKIRNAALAMRIAITDEQAGIEDALTKMNVPKERAQSVIQAARASYNAAEAMLGDSQYVGDKRVGDGLQTIFDPIVEGGEQKVKDFYMYLLNYHHIDRLAKDKPVLGNVSVEEAMESISKYEEKYSDFSDIAKKVWKYNENLLDYRVKYGLLSRSVADQLKEDYPHYVPTFRNTEGQIGIGSLKGKYNLAVKDTVLKAKGSTLDVMPIMRSMALQTMQVVRASKINAVVSELVNASKASKDKSFVEVVQSSNNGDYYKTKEKRYKANETYYKLEGEEYVELEKGKDYTVGKEITEDVYKMKKADPYSYLDEDYASETKNNQVTYFDNGVKKTVTVSKAVFDGIDSFSPKGESAIDIVTKPIVYINNQFKKLVTSSNPFFTIRNFERDLQEAMIYTNYSTKDFITSLAKAYKEIAKNGESWKLLKSAGGISSSIFNFNTGINQSEKMIKSESKSARALEKTVGLAKGAIDSIEKINLLIEQAPRLAEFMLAKKAGKSTEQALLESADVTTNFSRGGKLAKLLNRTVMPFLNPSIQGWSKLWRTVTGKKAVEKWISLIIRALVMGIGLSALNDLLLGGDDDYEALDMRTKETYYLFKLGDSSTFLKLPKGRVNAMLGSMYLHGKELAKGDETAFEALSNWYKTAEENVSPVGNFTRTIFDPILHDLPTNTSWTGGNIESQSMQNLKPSERYDANTSKISIAIGKVINYSPKKIDYLIDQYSGIIGDVLIPATSAKGSENIFSSLIVEPVKSNFSVDSSVKNKYANEFYDEIEKLTWSKYDGNASDALVLRYLNSVSSEVSEMYGQKSEIDSSKDSDKYDKSLALQITISATQKASLDNAEKLQEYLSKSGYEDSVEKFYSTSQFKNLTESQQKSAASKFVQYSYDMAMKSLFGTSIDKTDCVVKYTGKTSVLCYLAAIKDIESDVDSKTGKSVSGSKKKKVIQYLNRCRDISSRDKALILMSLGYTVNDGDISGLTASGAKNYVLNKILKDTSATKDEKASIAKSFGFEVSNGRIVTK